MWTTMWTTHCNTVYDYYYAMYCVAYGVRAISRWGWIQRVPLHSMHKTRQNKMNVLTMFFLKTQWYHWGAHDHRKLKDEQTRGRSVCHNGLYASVLCCLMASYGILSYALLILCSSHLILSSSYALPSYGDLLFTERLKDFHVQAIKWPELLGVKVMHYSR